MTELTLSDGSVAFIDEDDVDALQGYNWERLSTGHLAAMVYGGGDPEMILMCRLLTGAPRGTIVEFHNGNKLDNRRGNLALVNGTRGLTRQQLTQLTRGSHNRNNRSGLRGVSCAPDLSGRKPWRAHITVRGHNYHLGMWRTDAEARAARRAGELAMYGDLCS